MSSIALAGGMVAADEDDIDGVPIQALPLATGWLPAPSVYIPASLPSILSTPAIHPAKAALFTSGAPPVLSVNRVEQERAAAEDKKRRQDEEAKAVYADFVASFAVEPQQPTAAKPKSIKSPFTAFVRGGTIGGDNAAPANTPAKRTEPHTAAAASASNPAVVEPPWKRLRPASPPPPPAAVIEPHPIPAPAGRGKPRNIDLFLAELKQRQADPQAVRDEVQPSTPTTTNVFIAGLPLTTTESDLADEMVRYGDIASVKLLYPRTDEERARSTMNGFVAYMLRRDAEDAMREMNSTVWRGHPLKLHWSKPITLPSIPTATKANRRAATHQFVVQRPADPSRRSLIDQLALQVSQRGTDYEQSILEQHAHARTQPTHPYAFLFAIDSPDNLYYRWRVYSLRSGGGGGGTGGLERWDTRPFQMVPHGPTWLPPVEGGGARVDEQPRGTEESGMTSDEVGELQRLLSTLTLQRPSILATMGWCMEHAVAAPFIVRSICTALLSPSSDSCRRVSLLYLLSDLLYNSSAPVRNASLFRREASQPNNNSSLHSVWAAFSPQHRPSLKRQKDGVEDEEQPGSAAAVSREDEQQRQQHTQRVGRKEREAVLSVLRTWQTWSLFESERIEQWMLSVRGLQAVAAAQPAAASGQSPSVNPPPLSVAAAADTVDADDVDGVPLQ